MLSGADVVCVCVFVCVCGCSVGVSNLNTQEMQVLVYSSIYLYSCLLSTFCNCDCVQTVHGCNLVVDLKSITRVMYV